MDINTVVDNTTAVSVENLRVSYPDGRLALDGISFGVSAGPSVALLGANGAGKSTLLLALVGVVKATGSISIAGTPLSESSLPQVRRSAQIVFQDPNDQLFMPFLRDDVAFGPANFGAPPGSIDRVVAESLASVGLAGFEDRGPHQMSLGERKRAALATAIACKPEILLLDEPGSGLDGRGKRELVELLNRMECTKLIATHDLDFARATCGTGLVLSAGRIAATGDIGSLLGDRSTLESWGLA